MSCSICHFNIDILLIVCGMLRSFDEHFICTSTFRNTYAVTIQRCKLKWLKCDWNLNANTDSTFRTGIGTEEKREKRVQHIWNGPEWENLQVKLLNCYFCVKNSLNEKTFFLPQIQANNFYCNFIVFFGKNFWFWFLNFWLGQSHQSDAIWIT